MITVLAVTGGRHSQTVIFCFKNKKDLCAAESWNEQYMIEGERVY